MTPPISPPSKEIQKELGENALLIGRVTMQWTTIQAAIAQLFRRLSGLQESRSEAIFFAVKSDSSQRDMTLALARIALNEHPELLRRAIKLFNLLGDLSGERNAVTHAMWAVKMPEGRVTPMPRRGQHRRLKMEDHRAQFDTLLRDLSQMFRDLVKLDADIRVAFHQKTNTPPAAQAPSQTNPA